jgi:hypothetical protein
MFVAKLRKLNTKQLRTNGFSILAAVLAIVFLFVGTFEFIPAWILKDPVDAVHLWHIAELTTIAALLGGPLVPLIRRPQEKPLLVLFIVLCTILLAIGILPFEIRAAALLLIGALFVVAYPKRQALLGAQAEGFFSIALFGLSLLLAFFLVPIAIREYQWQVLAISVPDIHAKFLHWVGSSLMVVMLILAGILTATKRPGWKQLGIITGIAYCYLGVIAWLVPDNTGSWGYTGGFFAFFAGIFYILITLAEAQSIRKPVAEPAVSNTGDLLGTDEPLIAGTAQQ